MPAHALQLQARSSRPPRCWLVSRRLMQIPREANQLCSIAAHPALCDIALETFWSASTVEAFAHSRRKTMQLAQASYGSATPGVPLLFSLKVFLRCCPYGCFPA